MAVRIAVHLVAALAIATLMVGCILYPLLPGPYDSLARPLAIVVQAASLPALLLVPIGLGWAVSDLRRGPDPAPGQGFFSACAALVVGSLALFVATLAAVAEAGYSLGLLVLAAGIAGLGWLVPRVGRLRTSIRRRPGALPWYLVAVPTMTVLFPWAFASPLTQTSRHRAIANSRELIARIEQFRARFGRYPQTLTAMWRDYDPGVVGVERYHYARQGEGYNLFFEQPRLLLDQFGTREWVVYNPRDEHRVYSHTAWFLLLSPDELERSQGWYLAHDAGVPHWKYFWFD